MKAARRVSVSPLRGSGRSPCPTTLRELTRSGTLVAVPIFSVMPVLVVAPVVAVAAAPAAIAVAPRRDGVSRAHVDLLDHDRPVVAPLAAVAVIQRDVRNLRVRVVVAVRVVRAVR